MNIEDIKSKLKNIDLIYSDNNILLEIKENILGNKKAAVFQNDDILSKEYWCLEQIYESQNCFIEAFKLIKEHKYYDGWCKLEKSEIALHFLSKHFDINSPGYKLNFIEDKITEIQSLFPYKVFFSTELIEKKIQCSICDKVITPRNKCEHEIGEVYNGEVCIRKITDGEFIGIAVVQNPVHKYSVAFPINDKKENVDPYDYSVVKYLIDRLNSPFDNWRVERMKRRHPHENFSHIGRNELCPCGSGIKYKKCCLKESGVLMPHIEFIFANDIPKELQTIEYTYKN